MILPDNPLSDKPPLEQRLLTAGWRDPGELVRVCDAFNLRHSDFRDRLVEIAVAYVRECATCGVLPTLHEAAVAFDSLGVPHADGELYQILMDTLVPPGVTIVDLADDVLRASQERSERVAPCKRMEFSSLRWLP